MIGDVTIITFGPKEYLRRIGFVTEGELEYIRVTVKPTILDIQRSVAEHYQLPLREMTSARRAREVARPRQVAMHLCKAFTGQSLPQIGRKFGNRDHTTVIHAIRQIHKLRQIEPELEAHVSALEHQLEVRG